MCSTCQMLDVRVGPPFAERELMTHGGRPALARGNGVGPVGPGGAAAVA
jgi:hypothetical protein